MIDIVIHYYMHKCIKMHVLLNFIMYIDQFGANLDMIPDNNYLIVDQEHIIHNDPDSHP